MVAKAPSKFKRPRTDVDISIPSGYQATAQHEVIHRDRAKTEVTIKLQSAVHPEASAQTLVLLSGEKAIHTLHRWQQRLRLEYFGCSDVASGASDALQACSSARAWEGEGSLELDISILDHQRLHETLQHLQEAGVTGCTFSEDDAHRCSWHITRQGSRSLQCGLVLHSPVKATTPRVGVHVSEMTDWELMCFLEVAGWTPRVAASARQAPPFKLHTASPKDFWIRRGAKTANRPYFLVLANWQRLSKCGVQEIPHLQSASFYTDMLAKIGIGRGKRKTTGGDLHLQVDDGTCEVAKPPKVVAPSASGRTGAREDPSAVEAPAKGKARGSRSVHALTHWWGPCLMTFKAPNSWMARCCRKVSHAKPDRPTTGCTRTLTFHGEIGGEEDMLVRRNLYLWLNSSIRLATRTMHMAEPKFSEKLPSLDELERGRLPDDYNSDGGKDEVPPVKRAKLLALVKKQVPAGSGPPSASDAASATDSTSSSDSDSSWRQTISTRLSCIHK